MTPVIVFENGIEILQISLTFAQAKNHIIPPAKSGPRPSEFNTFDLRMCFAPQLRALFNDSTSKSAPRLRVFWYFWLRHVLRAFSHHNGAHLLNSSPAKSAPNLWCLQRFGCAPFQQLNVPKCSEAAVVFRADFKMHFAPQPHAICSCLISPNGSAPAALASLLFHPREPQTLENTPCFATFLFFFRTLTSFYSTDSFSSLTSSLLSLFWVFLFWLFLFCLCLFPDCSHHCCCICQEVRSLTSRHPSIGKWLRRVQLRPNKFHAWAHSDSVPWGKQI